MQATLVDFGKDRVIYNISGATKDEIGTKLNQFFQSEGYTHKSTEGDTHSYTKGNRTLRLLLGAFSKYHKQSVIIKNEGPHISVNLHKESSGISGGLIGMNQVKKEFARLGEALKNFLK